MGRGITPVLGVEDRTLKVLDGSSLAYAVPTQGSPTVLLLYQRTGGWPCLPVLLNAFKRGSE